VTAVLLAAEIGTALAVLAVTIEIIVVAVPAIIAEPASTPMHRIVADIVWYGAELAQDSLTQHTILVLVVLLDMLVAAVQDHGFGPLEVPDNALSTTWTITDKDTVLQQEVVAELDT
jgi:hypothetical protein